MDDDEVPTCPQVLRMATEHGAATTRSPSKSASSSPVGRRIGAAALADIAYPYLDRDSTPIDAVVHRAKSGAVDTVLVAESRFCARAASRASTRRRLEELAASLRAPLTDEEERRRRLAKEVFPHVKRFYDGYLAGEVREPYYLPSSRR